MKMTWLFIGFLTFGLNSFGGSEGPFVTSKVHQVVQVTTFPKSIVKQWLEEDLYLADVPGLPEDQHVVFFILDDVSPFYFHGKVPMSLPYHRFFVGIPFVRSEKVSKEQNFFYMPLFHVSSRPATYAGWYPYGLNKYVTKNFHWFEPKDKNSLTISLSNTIDHQIRALNLNNGEKLKDQLSVENAKLAFEVLKPMMSQPAIGFISRLPVCSEMNLKLDAAQVQPIKASWVIHNLKINEFTLESKSFDPFPLAIVNGFPQGSYLMDADFELSLPYFNCAGY